MDILQVLEGAHVFQQALSAEKTPTLSMALPAYALLIEYWKKLSRSDSIPQLAYIMEIGIAKIQEYMDKSRSSKIHVLAMAVNPSTKLQWIEQNWTSAEARQAKQWVLDHMVAFQKDISQKQQAQSASASRATSGAPRTGSPLNISPYPNGGISLAALSGLTTVRRSASLGSSLESPTVRSAGLPFTHENTPVPEPSPISPEEQEALDRRAAGLELENYVHQGTVDSESLNIMQYWQQHSSQYPTLYRIALDVLPVQASAVPCERVFSSSSETITKRRNGLSPGLVEALQHLKFLFRQQRPNFVSDQDVTDAMLSIEKEGPETPQMPVTREILRAAIASEDPEEALQNLMDDIEDTVTPQNLMDDIEDNVDKDVDE